jgi:hypothetical protein
MSSDMARSVDATDDTGSQGGAPSRPSKALAGIDRSVPAAAKSTLRVAPHPLSASIERTEVALVQVRALVFCSRDGSCPGAGV